MKIKKWNIKPIKKQVKGLPQTPLFYNYKSLHKPNIKLQITAQKEKNPADSFQKQIRFQHQSHLQKYYQIINLHFL